MFRFLFLALIMLGMLPVFAERLHLPPGIFGEEPLLAQVSSSAPTNAWQSWVGAKAGGDNNVGSLWRLTETGNPVATFGQNSAYATMSYGEWMTISDGHWVIAAGSGHREQYTGNDDAAQLWLDLHSTQAVNGDYSPTAKQMTATVGWWGVGRRLDYHFGQTDGNVLLFFRQLQAKDFSARSITGELHGEEYTAMARTYSTKHGSVRGEGWALDAQTEINLGPRWSGVLSAEALLGSVTWHGIQVDDDYVFSPRPLENPDGYWQLGGGISGASWREDVTLRLDPAFRADLYYRGNPGLLATAALENDRLTPGMGLAWSQRENWIGYIRNYPTEQITELGIVGRSWQFTIAGDEWLFADPKHATITCAVKPFTF